MEPQDILVIQLAGTGADLGPGDGGDRVHHQTARGPQAIALARLHQEAEQRRIGCVEAVVLNDDGARLPAQSPPMQFLSDC